MRKQYLSPVYPNDPSIVYDSIAEVLMDYDGVDFYWLRMYTTSLVLSAREGWYA